MAFGIKNILQGGLINNYSESSLDELNKEYGMYLMDNENIVMGFKLVRDSLVFTDKRIIFSDKQGATGSKTSIESINLYSIVNVKMETSGFGFDDSELTFTYIKTANMKAHSVNMYLINLNSLKNIIFNLFTKFFSNFLMKTVYV